ncbi:ATP synthase F1 subunit delta [bacterium SCSIO 12741]|nr:ATP synthase F1 subunit delta [bacterium SCSIO 12741]
MVASKVARRYAKSLLFLAMERGEQQAVFQQLQQVAKVAEENRDLRILLSSPVVQKDKKISILQTIFAGSFGELLNGFVSLLTKNNRESLLQQIAVAYMELYKAENKIVSAQVTTAIPMDDDFRQRIRGVVGALDSNEVEILEDVDAELIGGLKLRIGDIQVDASVARQLREIRNKLTNEDYIVKM